MRSLILVLAFPLIAQAGILNFWKKDPSEIEIRPAFNAQGERVIQANPITIRIGDIIELTQFEGKAFDAIKNAKLFWRRAETIRGVGYHNEIGKDLKWDLKAHHAFEEALNLSQRQTLTAGRDIRLTTLKRLLETEREYVTPNDGHAYRREYFVPVALINKPITSSVPPDACPKILESTEMLAREREAHKRSPR